jgi:hypothetical protein
MGSIPAKFPRKLLILDKEAVIKRRMISLIQQAEED